MLAWSALTLVVVRIGRTGNTRLWVPAGVIAGIGLASKHLIGFFAVALVVPAVGPGAQLTALLRHDFARIQVAATISNPAHVINGETGGLVYVCTGPVRSWGSLWPSFRYTG